MENKQKYEISVQGCDADTDFEIELTLVEYELILKVASLCNQTSTYSCMPRIFIQTPKKEVEG